MARAPIDLIRHPDGLSVREIRLLLKGANPAAAVWLNSDGARRCRRAMRDTSGPDSAPVIILSDTFTARLVRYSDFPHNAPLCAIMGIRTTCA